MSASNGLCVGVMDRAVKGGGEGSIPTFICLLALWQKWRIRHIVAECRKRRLYQGSFVLLYFALFAFSGLYLVSVLSAFLISLLSRIF